MDLLIKYRVIPCACGFTFAIPESWAEERENDHKHFYCPACKSARYYPQESDKERLERILNQERSCCIAAREDANYFEKRAQGYKGYATKLKNHIKEK